MALESCPASSPRLSKVTSLGNPAPQLPSPIAPAAKQLLLILPGWPAAAATERNPPPALPRSRPGLRTTKPLFGLQRFQLNKVWWGFAIRRLLASAEKSWTPPHLHLSPADQDRSDQDRQDCSCLLLKGERGCERIKSGLEILLLEQLWSLEPVVKLWNSSCLGFPGIYT